MYKCDESPACPIGYTCGTDHICHVEVGVDGDVDDDEFVSIPPGVVSIGCASSPAGCMPDAMPVHDVMLDGFSIERREVTESEYATCGSCTPASGTSAALPVRGVTYGDAVAYCTSIGRKLPSEAQWERAARGTDGDQQVFPWGSAPPTCALAQMLGCGPEPVAEDSLPAGETAEHIEQLAGNVREWVADYYDASFYMSAESRQPDAINAQPAGTAVIRGGSFNSIALSLTVWSRDSLDIDHGSDDLGFRCGTTL